MGNVRVRTHNTSHFARLMIISRVGANTNAPPRDLNEKSLYDYDGLYWPLVCNPWAYTSRVMSAGEIYGYNDSYKMNGITDYQTGWRYSPEYNATDDWQRFSSPIGGLRILVRALAGASAYSFQLQSNTQHKHLGLRGDFGPAVDPTDLFTWWDNPEAVFQQNNYCSYKIITLTKPTYLSLPGYLKKAHSAGLVQGATFTGGVPQIAGDWGTYAVSLGGRRVEELLGVLDGLVGSDFGMLSFTDSMYEVLGGGAVRYFAMTTDVTSAQLEFENGEPFPTLRVGWNTTSYKTSGAGGDSAWSFKSSLAVRPYLTDYSTNVTPTGWKVIPRSAKVRYEYTNTLVSASGDALSAFNGRGRSLGSSYQQVVTPTVSGPMVYYRSAFVPASSVGKPLVSHLQGLERSWGAALAGEWSHIEAALWYSQVQALDETTDALSTSQHQTLAKLGQIFSFADTFIEYWSIIKRATNGDVSTIKDLIEWMPSAILAGNFQYQPMANFILDFAGNWADAIYELQNSEWRVFSGKGRFEYTFPPGTFGRTVTKMVCKTTIQIDNSGSSVLRSLAGAKAAALYLSPTLAWDLLPFSFVVNWFLNIGARAKMAETSAAGLLYNVINVVHVIELNSPLEQADYDYLDVFHDGTALENRDALRYFRRYVSQYIAQPRESKFDYGANPSPLRWDLILSLIAQGLKGS